MICLLLIFNYQVDAEKRREEQRNFGVFFDDDYDYLQHLKESSGPSQLVASGPSHNKEAEDEEEDHSDMVLPVSLIFMKNSKCPI